MDTRRKIEAGVQARLRSDDNPLAEPAEPDAESSATPEWSEDSPEVEELTAGEKQVLEEIEEERKQRELEEAKLHREREEARRHWELNEARRHSEMMAARQQWEWEEGRRRWERERMEEEARRRRAVPLPPRPSPMGVNLAAGALREWTRVISCESCRIKKLKCDRVIGGCSNCRSRGHTCSYAGHPPTQHMDTVGLSALERNRQEIERLRTTMTSLVGKLGLSEQDVVSIQLDAEARYGVHVFQRTRPADPLAPPPLATLRRQGVTSQPRPPAPPPSMPPSIVHRPQPSTNAPPRPYYTQMALGPPKLNRHPPASKPPPPPPQQPQQHQHPSLPSPAYYSTTYAALASRPPVHSHPYHPPPPTLAPRVATAQLPTAAARPHAATPQLRASKTTPQTAAPQPPPPAALKFAPARPPTSAPSRAAPPLPSARKGCSPPPCKPRDDPENIIHRRGSDATVEVLYADGDVDSPLLKPKHEPDITTIDSTIASGQTQGAQPSASPSTSRHPSTSSPRQFAQQGEKRPHCPTVASPQLPTAPPSTSASSYSRHQPPFYRPIPQRAPFPPLDHPPFAESDSAPKRRKRSHSAPLVLSRSDERMGR